MTYPLVTSWNSLRTLLNMDMHTVVVGTSGVTVSDVLAVARAGARIELSDEAVAALAAPAGSWTRWPPSPTPCTA